MTSITRGEPQDADACTDLLRRAFADYAAALGRSLADWSYDWLAPALAEGRVLILREAGRPSAVAALEFVEDACHLRVLAVDPARQGGGLGARMVAAVLDHARAQGAARVTLHTAAQMTRLVAFYARMGFVPVRVGPPPHGRDSQDRIFFECGLTTTRRPPAGYDLAVVGAGIVGLAHALAAARRGLRVVVLDRDAQANGASVRNFGFVTVTGQEAGDTWRRARRSRDVWAEVAPQAGIAVHHRGLCVAAHRPEAVAVVEAFLRTEMGEDCALLTAAQARVHVPALKDAQAVLHSPHELRVESTDAIPRLAAWLAEAHGVEFRRDTVVHDAVPPVLTTSGGPVRAARVVVCPGDDYRTLHADRIAAYGLTKCQLQMLRVRPATPTRLGAAVMSDHGLARYAGYAALPETAALQARLEAETPRTRAAGIHLIAVQSGDGSLVVGDSHHYAPTPPPFASDRVDSLILDELHAVLDLPGAAVTERWTGIYASASDRTMLRDAPTADSRLVIVTGGTGASTAFAIGEETVAELFGKE